LLRIISGVTVIWKPMTVTPTLFADLTMKSTGDILPVTTSCFICGVTPAAYFCACARWSGVMRACACLPYLSKSATARSFAGANCSGGFGPA
jgi:hypothetical protein